METDREHELLDSFQLRGTPGKRPNKEDCFHFTFESQKEKKQNKSLRTNTLEPKTVEYTHKKREKMEEQNGKEKQTHLN